MKLWSKNWKKSKKQRKQRKYRSNSPLHVRQKMFAARVEKDIEESLGSKRIPLRKGDRVEIMRGDFKGKMGAVSKVDRKKFRIYIEGIERKKADGSKVKVGVSPSNVKIVRLNIDDSKRLKNYKGGASSKEKKDKSATKIRMTKRKGEKAKTKNEVKK